MLEEESQEEEELEDHKEDEVKISHCKSSRLKRCKTTESQSDSEETDESSNVPKDDCGHHGAATESIPININQVVETTNQGRNNDKNRSIKMEYPHDQNQVMHKLIEKA